MSRYDEDDFADLDRRADYYDERDSDERPARGYRCGGYAAYDGHCGATDCETCYPGCTAEAAARKAEEDEEQDEPEVLELDAEEVAS